MRSFATTRRNTRKLSSPAAVRLAEDAVIVFGWRTKTGSTSNSAVNYPCSTDVLAAEWVRLAGSILSTNLAITAVIVAVAVAILALLWYGWPSIISTRFFAYVCA